MSSAKVDNWRSQSSHKKRTMKTSSFRIKSKVLSLNKEKKDGGKQNGEPLYTESMTDPGPDPNFNTKSSIIDGSNGFDQSLKLDSLVTQIGGINQSPFRIDQKLLTRLHSNGHNISTVGSQEAEKLPLSEFLQVKSVSLTNQDLPKKNTFQKSGYDYEKPIKQKKIKKKLPSLSDQELNKTDDEEKKVKDKDLKQRIDSSRAASQGLSKSSSKQDKSRVEHENSFASLKNSGLGSTKVNSNKKKSESESPYRERLGKSQLENSPHKTDRRFNSITPRQEKNEKVNNKPDTRFGPLEKIKEIITTVKKPISGSNIQYNNSKGNNNNNQQPKVVPGRIVNVPLDPIAKTLLNARNSYSSNFNPISSIIQNGRNGQADFANALQSAMSPVKNNPHNIQQNKVFKPFSLGASAVQQKTASTSTSNSNSVLPLIMNQSQPQQTLSQSQNISSIITQASTLNTRPAYPILRPEELPKKKIVYIPPPQSNKLKFFIGGGNNAGVVKRILAKRDWWEQTEFFNTLFNLKWQQTYRGYRYDRLPDKVGPKQLVNHFEYHTEISTKDNLIKNLSNYCETNKINLFEITPLTFCFNMDDITNFDKDMQKFAKFFIKHHPDPTKYSHPNLSDKRSHNTWFNFDYRKKAAYHPYNSCEEKKKSQYVKPILPNTFLKKSNVWVLKPVGLNRGRGIEVFNSLETLNELINECFQPTTKKDKKAKKEDAGSGSDDEEGEALKKELSATSRTFVIQKYIEDTLLIHRRKFDVRVWVLVTHEMQLYFFKEGYLRLSSEEFSLEGDGVFNKFIHLTNNAVQKYSNCYGQHEKGNQLSFKDFEDYMKEHNLNGDFKGKILPRMKELVKYSMLSVGKQLNQNDRKHCFEVFGYDFMIDAEFNTWLIEVNTNPCIEESSPLLEMLIPRMIDDAFKLTVDVIFPKPYKKQNPQPQPKNVLLEEKKLSLDIVQSPLRATSKPLSEATTVETKTQSLPKLEETPRDKKTTLEVSESTNKLSLTDRKEDEIQTNTKYMSHSANEIEAATENKNFSTIETDTNSKIEEVKLLTSPEKSTKGEETTNQKPEIFRVEGYSDTENMWEHLCTLQGPKSPVKKDKIR